MGPGLNFNFDVDAATEPGYMFKLGLDVNSALGPGDRYNFGFDIDPTFERGV